MSPPRLVWLVVNGSPLWWSAAWNMGVSGALYAAECRGFGRGYLYVQGAPRLSAPR